MLILFISKEELTIQVYKYDAYEKKQNVKLVITKEVLERRKEKSVDNLAYYNESTNSWVSEYGDGLAFCDIQIIPEENPSVAVTFCPECGAEITACMTHMPLQYIHNCGSCDAAIKIKFGP